MTNLSLFKLPPSLYIFLCFCTLHLRVSIDADRLGDNFKEIYQDGFPSLWGSMAASLKALAYRFLHWHEQETKTL